MANILIVDDDAAIRETLRMLLEDLGGYSVYESADGEDALQQLRASQQRLVVLLDILMPKLNGDAVLAAVAADQRLATYHRYVLLTAGRQARGVTPAIRNTVPLLILPKPFDIDEVLDIVSRASQDLDEVPSP